MRILYLDVDTLRPDHLGCYGYHRNTSPNIDRLAAEGTRFEKVYVSDAPCLPSRASMFTGRFGIHTGVVNHGGLRADPFPVGRDRGFSTFGERPGLIHSLRKAGYYPVSISPFAERHSAWWFCEGWNEMVNPGKRGHEIADEVTPRALDWIARNGERDNWVLHVNLWDPHTPYRTPEDFGNPFADDPAPAWYTEEIRRRQWDSFGTRTPRCPTGSYDKPVNRPRIPEQIADLDDYKRWIDGYDCGIRYADEHCGRILNALADQGVLDDTLVIFTSDHGENQGELGVFGDHQTADHITSRVPMILRGPDLPAGRVDEALHYQSDVGATLVELAGGTVPDHWDARGFADSFTGGSANSSQAGKADGRDYVVFSQCCWACQRAVRWDDYVYIRTYHTGLKDLPERMLFNVAADPHEVDNLAERRPELADRGQALIEQGTAGQMASSDYDTDPMWTVMREGGPYHTRREIFETLLDFHRRQGLGHHADFLEAHPDGLRR
jgi:arylsulfatase A-like enzyme